MKNKKLIYLFFIFIIQKRSFKINKIKMKICSKN